MLKPRLNELGYDSVAVKLGNGLPNETPNYIVTAWKRARWTVESIHHEDFARVQGLSDHARSYRATIGQFIDT